jgi:hypothetical protein
MLNEAPNNAFSIEALGVKDGCRITDRRIGAEYQYGLPNSKNISEFSAQVAKAPVALPATVPTVVAGAPANDVSSSNRIYWLLIGGVALGAVFVTAKVLRQKKNVEKI